MDANILLIIIVVVIIVLFINRFEFYENFDTRIIGYNEQMPIEYADVNYRVIQRPMQKDTDFVGLNWDLRSPNIARQKYEYKQDPSYRVAPDSFTPIYSKYGFPINCQSYLSTNSLTQIGDVSGYHE